MTIPQAYVVALCHPSTELVFDAAGKFRAEIFDRNVQEYCSLIGRSADEHKAKLIAFPQFGLTSYASVSQTEWTNASLDFEGPEIQCIAEAARSAHAYVAVQTAERHAAFPGRVFYSAALITPQGEVGLIQRKHFGLSLRTSPNDVLDSFIAQFGQGALFPVLDTPLGRIGLTIGAEVHWPEAVRALALKGAELVVNPVAALKHIDYLERPGAESVRAVRAFENMAFLAMANVPGQGAPASEVWDYTGAPIGSVADDSFTVAVIDIAALRRARAQPSANFLAQIQGGILGEFDALELWPKNAFSDGPPENAGELVELETRVREQMEESWRSPSESGISG